MEETVEVLINDIDRYIARQDENVDGDNDVQSSLDNTFDMTLATSHSYLGNDLEILRGRTLLDNGIYIDLLLWLPEAYWSNKILFPGQTLPIMERDPHSIEMFRKCIAKDRTFGVASKVDINCIGTTAEIYEYSENSNANEIRVKAKGRQRFKILRLRNTSTRNMTVADVQILPEITLPPPFFEDRLVSLDRLRVVPTDEKTAQQYRNLTKTESMITPWPAWVHHQYDPKLLSMKIHKYLEFVQSRFIARGSNIPTDPVDLSFWVAQNVLISTDDMMTLLKLDCATSRLQMEVKLLKKIAEKIFVCKRCDAQIAKQADVFPMNQEGLQSAYVNPYGAIHETITLSRAQSLVLDSESPSTVCSWFPGYAWTIATCANCSVHIGWRFTSTKNELTPKSFWGLTRAALTWSDGVSKHEPLYGSSDHMSDFNTWISDDEEEDLSEFERYFLSE